MNSKKILFTGGGTAGHVIPNIALYYALEPEGWKGCYIGSSEGIEKTLIKPLGIPYYTTPTGKLRRYFSWQNFIDPFKVIAGIIKCTFLCFRLKPTVVFSKGGFVSLPVVIGAFLNQIPVILHESDLTPGLANKLCFPFAKKICLSFSETEKLIGKRYQPRCIVTGSPVRESLLRGNKENGLAFTRLSGKKPIGLIICGSLGSVRINETVRNVINTLLESYDIIHICGKGNIDSALQSQEGYRQYEFINEELGDIFACSDFVISRSGANALYELLTLKKLHLLIPLDKGSRGDQINNAAFFEKRQMSAVLKESDLNSDSLLKALEKLFLNKELHEKALSTFEQKNALLKLKLCVESFSQKES